MKEINRATIHHFNKENSHHAYYTYWKTNKYFWISKFCKFLFDFSYANFMAFIDFANFYRFSRFCKFLFGFMQGYESCKG